jgi:uncharacterized damage-inducible protein DinB
MKLSAPIAATIAIALSCPIVRAQEKPPAPANPISQAIRDAWAGAKRNMKESADQMPDADYAFRPNDQVRTFGQIIAHVAGASFAICSRAKGEKTPHEEADFEKIATTKADIIQALNDGIAYCDAAYTALTDRTAGDMIASGTNNTSRVAPLVSNVGHYQEHYGNLVTYFRLKGMVPPSSRR